MPLGRRPLVLLALLAALAGVVIGPAGAASAPVEPYARYEPQTTCSPAAKPGTAYVGRWLVRTYGGRFGSISRACAGRAVSEHKEGRAFDWTLNVRRSRDRARAARFLRDALATGPSGEPAELARRMGVMYVIWNDRIYSAYRGFAPRPYLNPACRSLRRCSATLRHRDHLHVSLTRAAAGAHTSWYVGRVPGAVYVPPAPAPTPAPTPTPTPTLSPDGDHDGWPQP